MDLDQATLELRRALVRDTQKEVARNEEIDAVLRDLLFPQSSRFRGPMLPLKPARNYIDGQREVVQTRTRDYTTRPAVKAKPTRTVAGRNMTGKAGAGRGAPLGAGAGGGSGGSDDDEDKNRRKRPLPKDASDLPRKRKKGQSRKDDDSQGNESGQADADRKSAAKSEPPLGQTQQRRNRLGGLLSVPARNTVAGATRAAPSEGSHPNDHDASSKSKDGDGRRPENSPVWKGRAQGPSRRGPFQQESSESKRDVQRSPDRPAPHSQRSLPDYKDENEANGAEAPAVQRLQGLPTTPETTEQALERVQGELSMREMLTMHDILIGDPSNHIKKYIVDALSRSFEPSEKAKSVDMINQLSKVYGNGSIWADAGDIENYLIFGIDEEEMWNDRSDEVEGEAELEALEVQHSGPRWDPQWSRVAKQIDRIEAVSVLYRKAKSIAQKCASEDLHVKPNDVSGRTPEQYLADLEAVIALNEREVIKGTWDVYAERLTRDYDITGGLAAKLQAKFVELETSMQQFDDKAKRPKQEASEIAWLYVADKGEDKRDSVRAKARFDDLVSAATRLCDDGQIVLPPEWEEDLSLAEYCEEITNMLDRYRTTSVRDSRTAWEHAIKVARATGDKHIAELTAGLQQFNRHVAAGGHPFSIKMWDREQVPRTPSPPGSPATLAQDIGFDGKRAQLDDTGNWSFTRILGSGGFGNVSLWERTANNGAITDRIAMKETYLGPLPPNKTGDHWTSGRYWHGEIHNRYPQEAALMLYLNSFSNSKNIVQCRAYASYDVKKMFRLYLEFCDQGDLQSLIHTQAQRNLMFPARILWSIFESLTAASCIMQLGHLPSSPPPQTHDAVIHQDIKPANIFLKSRTDAENWRDIPFEAVLGDFGLAQLESDPNCRVPGTGTKGYKAPEQYIYDEDHPRFGEENVGSHSDVWVVGRVMLSLMDLEVRVRDVKEFRWDDADEVPEFKEGEYWSEKEERLWRLVMLCLRKEPGDRIGIKQLWEEVQEVVGRMDDREGYGGGGTPIVDGGYDGDADGDDGAEVPVVDGGYDGLAR